MTPREIISAFDGLQNFAQSPELSNLLVALSWKVSSWSDLLQAVKASDDSEEATQLATTLSALQAASYAAFPAFLDAQAWQAPEYQEAFGASGFCQSSVNLAMQLQLDATMGSPPTMTEEAVWKVEQPHSMSDRPEFAESA